MDNKTSIAVILTAELKRLERKAERQASNVEVTAAQISTIRTALQKQ